MTRRGEVRIDPVDWPLFIPQRELDLYAAVFAAFNARKLPFAIGGGLAFSAYARRWRYTKDLDLYIRPADSDAITKVLQEAGFPDFFNKQKYDQGWSYRGHQDDVIIDLLWGMANYRTWVDDAWLSDGPLLEMGGQPVRLLPAEELLFAKLYVVQRGRCDWPDLLNILFAVGPQIDWERVLRRVGEDAPVVGGLLSVFSWLCPAKAQELPKWLWERVGLTGHVVAAEGQIDGQRSPLLGHGDWFGPTDGPVKT